MSGINHLSELYNKRGKEFVEKLFDMHVTINEKMDGSSFQFEKNPYTSEVEFFKRNSTQPIGIVDRILMKYYEKPIEYINNLPKQRLEKLPKAWRFGLEYFSENHTHEIQYDRTPKNNLILSYIHVKNNNGKVIRTIQDKEELNKWSDILGVERAPIIFQGKLDDEQKVKILEFLDTPFDSLKGIFKTNSFVRHIVAILNPNLKKTALNNSLDQAIEGIVFRFSDLEKEEVVLAKLVDPMFEQLSKDKTTSTSGNPSDIYSIAVVDMMQFINSLNLKKHKSKGKTFEERYIDFICDVFNKFIEESGAQYKNMDFQTPDFMKKDEFDLNDQFIKNDKTVELVKSDKGYKQIFKIMLASFRKKKKKQVGIMNKEVLVQFNMTVDLIKDLLSHNLSESLLPSFTDFIGTRENDDFVDPFENETADGIMTVVEPETETPVFKVGDIINPEQDNRKDKNTRGKKCNIIVGRFQPFHNGHLDMAKELYAANKLPVVIVVVHPGHNNNDNSPFTIPTQKSVMDGLLRHSNNDVIDYVFVENAFLDNIINGLRPKYEPILWGCGEDRVNGYKKQLEFNYKQKNPLKLSSDFSLMVTTRTESGTDVRELVRDDNFSDFKSKVPSCVSAQWILLGNDMKSAKKK
jgi:cytidyltransferase-like protein